MPGVDADGCRDAGSSFAGGVPLPPPIPPGPFVGLAAGGDGSWSCDGEKTCCASGDEVMPWRTDPERALLRKPLWGEMLVEGAEGETCAGAGAGDERPDWVAESCGERSELMSISASGLDAPGERDKQRWTTLETTERELPNELERGEGEGRGGPDLRYQGKKVLIRASPQDTSPTSPFLPRPRAVCLCRSTLTVGDLGGGVRRSRNPDESAHTRPSTGAAASREGAGAADGSNGGRGRGWKGGRGGG